MLLRELLLLECEYALRQQSATVRARLAKRFAGNEALIDEVLEWARRNFTVQPILQEKTEVASGTSR